jgi:hypothetical protein
MSASHQKRKFQRRQDRRSPTTVRAMVLEAVVKYLVKIGGGAIQSYDGS